MMMRFEKILPNGRLWATVYEGEETNTLDAHSRNGKMWRG